MVIQGIYMLLVASLMGIRWRGLPNCWPQRFRIDDTYKTAGASWEHTGKELVQYVVSADFGICYH